MHLSMVIEIWNILSHYRKWQLFTSNANLKKSTLTISEITEVCPWLKQLLRKLNPYLSVQESSLACPLCSPLHISPLPILQTVTSYFYTPGPHTYCFIILSLFYVRSCFSYNVQLFRFRKQPTKEKVRFKMSPRFNDKFSFLFFFLN